MRQALTVATVLGLVVSLVAVTRPLVGRAAAGDITTFAGNGNFSYGGDNGPATAASIDFTAGVAVDAAGNVYIAEWSDNVVRKVDTSGTITTFAGTGGSSYSGDGGPATAAQLNSPTWVAIDAAGNVLICDRGNNVIRSVSASGIITTVAGNGNAGYAGDGGSALQAELNGPDGLVALPGGGFLVSDAQNNVVRKVDASGNISTFAGNGTSGYTGDNGPATSAEVHPAGLAVDAAGRVLIADPNDGVIRRVDGSGTITTFAGTGTSGYSGDGGPATSAELSGPRGLAVRSGSVFVSDNNNQRVRQIDATGSITTVAGNGQCAFAGDGGPATAASFCVPWGLAFDSNGNLLVADMFNARIRIITAAGVDLVRLSTAAPLQVGSGQAYSYTFNVANPGTGGGATGVTLSDPLPAGLTFVSATATQGSCSASAGSVSCPLGSLAAGATATVTINVTAPSSSTSVTNTGTVTTTESDPLLADNTASATTFVDAADLSVSAVASPDPANAGQPLTYAVTVQNGGDSTATNVNLTVTVPPGSSLQSDTASQGSCTLSGSTVRCNLGTLANGGTATAGIVVVPARTTTSLMTTMTVAADQIDPNAANNSTTVQTDVVIGTATQFVNPQSTPTYPGRELAFPAGITAGADGNIWFPRLFPNFGEYGSMVGRITPGGVYLPAYSADMSFMEDMTKGPDGNVWFGESGFSGDPGGQSVGSISPQGKVTLFNAPCHLVNCSGRMLTVGPDGNIWYVTAAGFSSTAPPQWGIGRVDVKTGSQSFFPTKALVNDLTTGPDGNLWFEYAGGQKQFGRMTSAGVETDFSPPGVCYANRLVTGPDRLLWVTDLCGKVEAYDVSSGQPRLATQITTPNDAGDITAGRDAVYFTVFGSGPVLIGRATTAGATYYSSGTGSFVQSITAGPDGNVWFTDFVGGKPAIGRIAPPTSPIAGPIVGAPKVVGHGAKGGAQVNGLNLASGADPTPAHAKPPVVTGATQCPDTVNPFQGTVFNGDVTVNDDGEACFLNQVTINGNLHITTGFPGDPPGGGFADLSFATVNGSITIDGGGELHIVNSHVTGTVTATGSSFLTVFSSKIDGGLTSNPSNYGVAMICGTTVGLNLTDSASGDTSFPSTIGDPTGPIPCTKNIIQGNLVLSGNAEQILVHGNNVTGNIVVTNNTSTAPFDIRNNNAASLQCSGNSVAPTGGGNTGTLSGQCKGLR